MEFSFIEDEKERFLEIAKKFTEDFTTPMNYFASSKEAQLEAIMWLKENGCAWNEWTIICAAEEGHLEIIKWLRQHGCPWSEHQITYARYRGCHAEVLEWLRANGAPE